MAVKKNNRGTILAKVNGFDVREVPTISGQGSNKAVTASELCIFAGKNKLKTGLKNKQEAINYILNTKYDKRNKKFIV